MKTKLDLKVTSVRYFETRRGLGYECKTNNRLVTIWNDGQGGCTYLSGDAYNLQFFKELSEWDLEDLINQYEKVNQ